MKTVVISAFDAPFFDYATRMYDSVRAFHPELELYAGDLGLLPPQRDILESMGVKVLQHPKAALLRENKLRLCFGDFLLYSFLEDIYFDQVMWIDADTMVLRRMDEALNMVAGIDPTPHYPKFCNYVIGHPGRHAGGPIRTMGERFAIAPGTTHRDFIEQEMEWIGEGKYIATGLWLTTDIAFLHDLDEMVYRMHGLTDDSPVFSALMNFRKMQVLHLDPATWNFSRHLVNQARYEHGQIVYGNGIKPFTVGFSLTDNGTRLGSPAIDQFYRDVICPRVPRDRK